MPRSLVVKNGSKMRGPHLGRDPDALVLQLEPHATARLDGDAQLRGDVDVLGAHGDRAASRHRLAGVEQEIVDDLADLAPIAAHRPQVVGEQRLARDVRPTQAELDALANDLVDRQRCRDRLTASGEREQLPRQIVRLLEHGHRLAEALGRCRPVLDLAAGQLEAAEDAGEQVVEIVGDAARQQPQALQLLRLAQLLFRLPRFAHVAEDQHHANDLVRSPQDGSRAVADGQFAAVLRH